MFVKKNSVLCLTCCIETFLLLLCISSLSLSLALSVLRHIAALPACHTVVCILGVSLLPIRKGYRASRLLYRGDWYLYFESPLCRLILRAAGLILAGLQEFNLQLGFEVLLSSQPPLRLAIRTTHTIAVRTSKSPVGLGIQEVSGCFWVPSPGAVSHNCSGSLRVSL